MHAMTTADLADRLERFRIDQEEPIKAKRLLVAVALRLRELDAALHPVSRPSKQNLFKSRRVHVITWLGVLLPPTLRLRSAR